MTLIVRQTVEDLAGNTDNYINQFDTVVRNDHPGGINGIEYLEDDSIALEAGLWRVTGIVVSQDGDVSTTAVLHVAVATRVLAGTIYYSRIGDRRVTGTNRPAVDVSGLILTTATKTAIGLWIRVGDSTARDWELELQITPEFN